MTCGPDLQVGRAHPEVCASGRPKGLHYISVAFLFCLWFAAPVGAQSFDPAYRCRTLPTTHFRIHFHQGEDNLAGRLALIAEETWHTLTRPLGNSRPLLTHVVLVDQSDLANAFAAPLPRNTTPTTVFRSRGHSPASASVPPHDSRHAVRGCRSRVDADVQRSRPEVSFGAELSAKVVAGYVLPLTVTVGGAWGRDGSRRVPSGATWYARIGHAF